MALQGTLDTFALPDVLRLLAATRKSGELEIHGDLGAGRIAVAGGDVVAVSAEHAPLALDPVEATFELLRFSSGSFTFDATAVAPVAPGERREVDALLDSATAMLAEWREIEAVVPSLDSWVSLQPALPSANVTIDQGCWATLVAIGAGATVRTVGDRLELGELPVSRAVRDLVVLDLATLSDAAPEPVRESPVAAAADPLVDATAPDPAEQQPSAVPAHSVPGEVPAHAPAPDAPATAAAPQIPPPPGAPEAVASESPSAPAVEEADQSAEDQALSSLSPRAAHAVRAAAERPPAGEEAADPVDEPLNRGLLLKFLSSSSSSS